MDWNVVGVIVAAAVGGLIALSANIVNARQQHARADQEEAQTAAREFITWLVAFRVTVEKAGLDAANDIEFAAPLLESITRFRLSPVFTSETLELGERFHDAINSAARNAPASSEDKKKQDMKCYELQLEFEQHVREDLGRPLPSAPPDRTPS
jgi:uncharacterized membrane protein